MVQHAEPVAGEVHNGQGPSGGSAIRDPVHAPSPADRKSSTILKKRARTSKDRGCKNGKAAKRSESSQPAPDDIKNHMGES